MKKKNRINKNVLNLINGRIEKERIQRVVLQSKLQKTEREFEQLRASIQSGTILVSQTIMKAIIDALPDPNQIANMHSLGRAQSFEKIHKFVDNDGYGIQTHTITIKDDPFTIEYHSNRKIKMMISEYDMQFSIPLRQQNRTFQAYGIDTSINTWIWDLKHAGFVVVTDMAWAMAISFMKAQRNIQSNSDWL